MAKRKPSARQKQHQNLKKLKEAGLYSGKTDARRKITGYQQTVLNKFQGFLSGLQNIFRPKNPRSFKGIFQTVKDMVLVPKTKGTRTHVNKEGELIQTRKGPRGEKITRKALETPPQQIPPRPPETRRVQYAIPFARKVGRGQYAMEWHRFPDWTTLNEFMQAYQAEGRYQDWLNYVFEEEITDHTRAEKDAALNQALIDHGRVRHTDEIIGAARKVRARRKRNKQAKKYQRRRERDG